VSRRLPLLICAVLTGCIAVPHPVEPEITESDTVVLPAEDILLTVGPRNFLELMQAALLEIDPGLEVVDGFRFRDAAFPEGGWKLAQLLISDTRERLRRDLPVDYLLLFSPMQFEDKGVEGPNTLTLGIPVPAGVGQVDEESTLSGVIIDLSTGRLVSQVDVTAAGSTSFAIWIILAVGTYPETGKSAMKGMARALATEIRGHSKDAHPRVVLMAAEAERLWKPIGAGGWAVLDSASDVSEEQHYRVFGFCGLQDDVITLQGAFDRAMDYYRDEKYRDAYGCFQFVVDAGAGSAILVADARRYINFMINAGLITAYEHSREADEEFWSPGGAVYE
jgi:hypothetical protein